MRTKSGCVFGHLFCGPPKSGVNVLCVYIILYQLFEKPAPGLARRGCFCGVTALRLFRRSCCGARTCLRAGTAPVFARNLVPRRAAPQGLRPCDAGHLYFINCKYLAGEGAVSEPFIWIYVDLLQFLGRLYSVVYLLCFIRFRIVIRARSMPVPFFPDGADVPAPFPVGYRSSLDRFADRRRDAAPFAAARMPARTGPGGARPDCPALPSPRPDGGDDEKTRRTFV